MSIWTREEGSQIVEAALTLPIVLLFLLGILIVGRGLNVASTLQYAAQQSARRASQRTSALSGNEYFPDQAAVAATLALVADNLDPSQVQSLQINACACGTVACSTPVPCDPLSPGEPQVCIQSDIQLAQSTNQKPRVPACGVAVSFRYPYEFFGKQIFLSASAEALEEH